VTLGGVGQSHNQKGRTVKSSRVLVAAAVVALSSTAVPAFAAGSSAAHGTATPRAASVKPAWGPYYSPGHRARAAGRLHVDVRDPKAVIPVGTGTVSGTISDRSRARACGVAVFRITYLKADGTLPFKQRNYWSCAYNKQKAFHFSDRNVFEVELKVCSEGRASSPSAQCVYGGSWKILYVGR
jgi:hypothetical protein